MDFNKLYRTFTALPIVVTFAVCAPLNQASADNTVPVHNAIVEVSETAHALRTYVGLTKLAHPRGAETSLSKSRASALNHAHDIAVELQIGLKRLARLRPRANSEQRHVMDEVERFGQGQLIEIDAIFAIEEEGYEDVSSCHGWLECFGFRTACEAAGGKWESWDGFPYPPVETCTTTEQG